MSPSTASQQQGILLTQFSTGSILDDADVTIADAMFVEWDYQGKIDHKILALGIQYKDENDKEHDQYYSAGELTYFVPSPDGAMAVPVADKQMLTDNCNAAKFILSLLESGFPPDQLGSSVKALIGLKCHVKQHAQPKRQGLIRNAGDDKEKTVLLVTQILAMPGAVPAGGAKTTAPKTAMGTMGTKKAPAATPASASASASKVNGAAGASTVVAGVDERALAADILNDILAEAGGSLVKKELNPLVFRAAGAKVVAKEIDTATKNKIVQLLFKDEFLHELAQGGAIAYDGTTVSFPG